MISLVALFMLSMVGCCVSANLALMLTRSAMQPQKIGHGLRARRLTKKYAAGSFAILAAVAFGGVCSSLFQIFQA